MTITARIAILLIALGVSQTAGAQPPSRRPDILVILADDLGWNDLSCQGSREVQTPHIDSLRRSGMRLDAFYANSPVCAPTRAALMSGRYPDRVGVPGLIRTIPTDNWGYLDPGTVLLPAMLKASGYHTAHVGKWNLGFESPNLPNEKGFDHFHGWLEDMMDDYRTHRRHGRNYMRLNRDSIDPQGHATDLFTQWSVDYIRSRASSPQPFFLYLAYNAPHFPVQPPREWLDRVRKRLPDVTPRRAALIALIEHMDAGIGRVIQALRETGRLDNTLILFTGDNGGNLADSADNGPLRDGKQSMYEGGLRVPTLATWRGHIPPNSTSSVPLMSMDISPTLLELTGTPVRSPSDGRSFLPVLMGSTEKAPGRPMYFIRREGGLRYGGNAYHALRIGPWKLLQNSPYAPQELYNLDDDPLESRNRIDAEPEVRSRLNAILMHHIQEGGKTPWQRR
jgi:arylsulfatase A-like enzyme